MTTGEVQWAGGPLWFGVGAGLAQYTPGRNLILFSPLLELRKRWIDYFLKTSLKITTTSSLILAGPWKEGSLVSQITGEKTEFGVSQELAGQGRDTEVASQAL